MPHSMGIHNILSPVMTYGKGDKVCPQKPPNDLLREQICPLKTDLSLTGTNLEVVKPLSGAAGGQNTQFVPFTG